ncbi:hypothetical protein JNM87_05985 [Candidatus Saccharibacteria bacterium]|nr:hypothetical protein [Candidatus Saccharibacteria bacterium]
MGFLDNLMKSVDGALEAVEKGALEDKLNQFADAVESKVQQAPDTIDRAAEASTKAAEQLSAKKDALQHAAQRARQGLREVGDIVRQPE